MMSLENLCPALVIAGICLLVVMVIVAHLAKLGEKHREDRNKDKDSMS